jgi:hypothetical protein
MAQKRPSVRDCWRTALPLRSGAVGPVGAAALSPQHGCLAEHPALWPSSREPRDIEAMAREHVSALRRE